MDFWTKISVSSRICVGPNAGFCVTVSMSTHFKLHLSRHHDASLCWPLVVMNLSKVKVKRT